MAATITPAQVARRWGVSPSTVYLMVKKGILPRNVKPGCTRELYFTKDEIDAVPEDKLPKKKVYPKIRKAATGRGNGRFTLTERETLTIQLRPETFIKLRALVKDKALLVEDAIEQMINHCLS